MQRAVLFIAVGVLTHAGLAQAQGCAMSGGACICDGYDLTAVQTISNVVGPGTSWGDWQYTFDLCNPITVPAECTYWGITTTNSYRLEDYQYVPECESLSPNPTSVSVTPAGNGLTVLMTDGSRTLTLTLNCATAQGTVNPPPANGDAITMTWDSPAGCGAPGGGPGQGPGGGSGGSDGLSFGWAFFITFSVAGVLYTGGGWYYNHKQKGMEASAEALPHQDFWKTMLPGLVKDGIYYSRNQLSTRWPQYFNFLDPGPGGPPSSKGGEYGRLATDDEEAALAGEDGDAPPPKEKKKSKKKKVPKKTPELEPPKE